MKYILIVILVGTIFLVIQNLAKGRGMEKSQIKAKIDAGALVIDVRTPQEFAEGHYPKALNIPVDQIAKRSKELGSKDREIILYCRSGNRSGMAKQILESQGFKKVYNAGGLTDMP